MKKLLIPIIILTLILTIYNINTTYAYYDELTKVFNINFITTSYENWSSENKYTRGDIVLYNGFKYLAIKNNVPWWVHPESIIGGIFWLQLS